MLQSRKLWLLKQCALHVGPVCTQHRWSTNLALMTNKRKEVAFERLVQKDMQYKKVLAIKELLLREPKEMILVKELSFLRKQLGLKQKSRVSALIRKCPAFFGIYVDENRQSWVGFSRQAEEIIRQEKEMLKEYEAVALKKLRKLLMMSVDKRLCVANVAHLRRDLGFPFDFQKRVLHAYPEYFKVVDCKDGPAVELTCWDSSLAISSLERRAQDTGERNSDGLPMFKICPSKAIRFSLKEKACLEKFQECPFLSPYEDIKDANMANLQFEKRQVALLHEILSMTLDKRTLVDHLAQFRKAYVLPRSVLHLLLKHHAIFYVSRRGNRFNVFLKEAYDDGELIEKHELMALKQRFLDLMNASKRIEISYADLLVRSRGNGLSIQDAFDEETEQAGSELESVTDVCNEGSFSDYEEPVIDAKLERW